MKTLPADYARCMGSRCNMRESCARFEQDHSVLRYWIDPDPQGAACAERIPVESDE